MAEDRLNDMNAVLQSMQKTLECNICLDLLDKPLTTKCGHSFCAFCIGQCFKKGQSRGVQCPLCLSAVTKRSLGKNEKISSLVIAVREIISSIKKDCCFEITPSKYRPRARPALEVSPEDNDSENEENDEPRRGSRKRAVPNHYQVVLDVPKPRRGPKQRVLSTHGEQELQLHTGYNSNSSIAERIKSGSSRGSVACKYEENFDENSEFVDYDQEYFSPSKRQEPVEVTGSIAVKGKGKQTENKVKQRKVAESNAKVKQKSVGKAAPPGKPVIYSNKNRSAVEDVSASEVAENKIFILEKSIKDDSQEHLSEKLGREAPNKKVEKWLNQSREIGFRIGESQSQSVPSEESEASDEESKESFDKGKGKIKGAGKSSDAGHSNFNSSKKNSKQLNYTNGATSSNNGDMKNQSIRRFLKSKPDDYSESNNYIELQSSQETQVFKPDQKTLVNEKDSSKRGRGGKVQGGAGLSRTRSRGNIRASVASQRSTNAQADHARIKEVIIDTSTPKSKSLKGPKTDIDLSLIDPNRLEDNTKTVIRNDNEDLDDDFPIPDSCPVNTKNEFDILVDSARNIESDDINKTTRHGINVNKVDMDDDFYFYQTPPQGDDINIDMTDGYDTISTNSKNHSKKRSHKHANSDDDDEDYKPTRKSMKTKKRGEKIEEQIPQALDQPRGRLRNRVPKSNEDADAISYAFEEVRKYHLNEETNEATGNKRHDKGKKKNISMIDETINNTALNRNGILSKSLDSHMPPPKIVPSRGRNVKKNLEEDKEPSECSKESSWAIKRVFESLTSEVCNATNDVDSLVDSSVKSTGAKGNVRFSTVQTRLVEPRKVEAKAVNIKETKSPGWSHIVGAKKDLKTRHNILNITGCDVRNLNDSRTEFSSFAEASQVVLPSSEDSDLIEDADQKLDAGHKNVSKKNKKYTTQNNRDIIDNHKIIQDEEEKAEEKFAKENKGRSSKDGLKASLKNLRKQQEPQSEKEICETEPFEMQENCIPNKKIKEILSSIESEGSSDIIPSSLKSNKEVNPGSSHGLLGKSPASKLSLSRRKTFDLAANPENLARSPNSYESKPRLPHHDVSPSLDSEMDDVKQISSNRVPFRSAGPLCSDKCVQAGEPGFSLKSLGPDICMHQVPCEVYQVLMKYMDIITQQKQQHNTCCSKKDTDSKNGSSPSSGCSNSKQPSSKCNREIIQDASEVPTQVWHPPQNEDIGYIPNNRMNKPSTEDNSNSTKSHIDVKAAESSKDIDDHEEDVLSNDELESTGESEPGVPYSQPLFDMKETEENTINVALADTELMSIDVEKRKDRKDGNIALVMENESNSLEFKKLTEEKLLNGYVDSPVHDNENQIQQKENLKVLSDSKIVSKELLICTVSKLAETDLDGENRSPSSKASSLKQASITLSTKEKMSRTHRNENTTSNTSKVISHSSQVTKGSQENIMSKEEKNYVNIHSQNSEESQHSTSLLSHPNSSNGTNRSTRSTRNTNNKHNVRENEDKKTQQISNLKKEKQINNNTEENYVSEVLVEKENLKNIGNVQQTSQSKLGKRKPLQNGQILQENILSQKLLNLKDKSSRIEEIVGSQSSVLVQNATVHSSQKLNPPFTSLVQSGNSKKNEMNQNERNNNSENTENTSMRVSKDDRNANCSNINVGSGNYKRIRRPTSDGSSEDSLESEELLHPKKRSVKRIPSSDSNPTPSKSSKDGGRTKKNSQELQQDSEELENLRDMERLDQNVWDYFGRPEDDENEDGVTIKKEKKLRLKKKVENIDDVNNEIIDPSQDIVEVPSQMKELSDLDGNDAPMHFEENTALMDNTQNMAAVMRNLQSDIDLVKNVEEKDNDSDIMEVEPSQESYQQSFILPSIAASASHPINKVIEEDKNILNTEESIFETNSISQDPAFLKGKEDEKLSKESIDSNKKRNVPPEGISIMEDSSEEFDTEQEDETENMSHSSAYSSQSEEITTQKKEQIQEELENLRAQKNILESKMNQKKENEHDIVNEDKDKSAKRIEESSTKGFVSFCKESIKEHAEEFELDVLPPTCPMEQDPDEDLFGSLPNLTNSTTPLQTTNNQGQVNKNGKYLENLNSVTSNVGETDQNFEQVSKNSPGVKGLSKKLSINVGSSIKDQKYAENSQKSINKGYAQSESNSKEILLENKQNNACVDQKQNTSSPKSISNKNEFMQSNNSNSNNEIIKPIVNSKVSQASSSAECESVGSSRAKSSSQYLSDGFVKAVLICTGLTSSEMGLVHKFIGTLAPEGTSINKAWSTQVTHVVVKPDEDGQAQRTLKYLYGVAGSRWIVSLQWIYDCLNRNKLLNEDDYEVVDTTGNSGPLLSRNSQKPLFHEAEFYLVPPFNDISITQLTELLQLCGANVVSSMQKFSVNPDGGIMQLVLFQGDGEDDPQVIDGNDYSRLCVAHDWIIECIGTFSHLAIRPYLLCDPSMEQINNSGVSPLLVEETQDIQ